MKLSAEMAQYIIRTGQKEQFAECRRSIDRQQKAIMKVYHKYQQREYERIEHPTQFPSDYFFSALAELVLDD